MATDDERREVAERLRECRGGWSSGECYYTIIHALGLPDTSREDGGAALYARLSDLIEPDCDRDTPQKVAEEMFGKMRHSTKEEADAYEAMLKSMSVEIHPVDRDALLALADELEEDACWEVQTPGDASGAWRLKDVCDRIREACGEGAE